MATIRSRAAAEMRNHVTGATPSRVTHPASVLSSNQTSADVGSDSTFSSATTSPSAVAIAVPACSRAVISQKPLSSLLRSGVSKPSTKNMGKANLATDITPAEAPPPSMSRIALPTASSVASHLAGVAKKKEKMPSEPVLAKATTLYSGEVNIVTQKRADGTYRLKDTTRGNGVVTYDGATLPYNEKRLNGPYAKVRFKNHDNEWGKADDNHARAAIDAHYGAQMTYDFYKDVLGRDSIDGKGAKIISFVHVTDEGAAWDGSRVVYGDGDEKLAPLIMMDVVGHEITHGLIQHTAKFHEAPVNSQSHALSEAFSDIMGTGVKWYAAQKNKAVEFNWMLGQAERRMDDPSSDGESIDHLSKLKSEMDPHLACGITNNAFYLLTEGGKNRTSGLGVDKGIGMERALKIFGRALISHMKSNDNHSDARRATIQAATDLYGTDSVEVQKVKDAWSAVGVKDKHRP